MTDTSNIPRRTGPRVETILFFTLLLTICVWVLSLPLFPSQDGAAHKFYAHIIQQLLAGNSQVGLSYQIRHPFPPYASQDLLLVLLSHLVSFDLADQIFVCLAVITTAVGVRWCCTWLGSGGHWSSLFVFPLLIHWSLCMGFMNYALGLGLLFMLFGCWMRASKPKSGYWIAFILLTIIITFTHPVPLLLLLGLCCFDLATQTYMARRQGQMPDGQVLGSRLGAIFLLAAALAYPVLAADPTRTKSDFLHSIFHLSGYITNLTLRGLSPYARHSHAPLVLLYKLLLYAMLVASFAIAARGFRLRWKANRTTRCDFLLILSTILYISLPLLPASINGSQFSTRLMPMVWLGLLMAASQAEVSANRRTIGMFAAALACLITLLPAERYIRPASKDLARIEATPLPPLAHGLQLAWDAPPTDMSNLEFAPITWAPMLAMMHDNDIMVNSPWLDLTSYPVAPGTDPSLMINEIQSVRLKQAIDLHDGDLRFLPLADQNHVLQGIDFIVSSSTSEGHDGRIGSLSVEQSQAFVCSRTGWETICLRRKP